MEINENLKYLSKRQINDAIQHAATINDRYYTIIITLAKTGCRVSELVAITPNDLLFEEKQIIIRGKGNKIRNIDITADLLMQLQLFIKNRKIKKKDRIIALTIQRITQITKRFANTNAHSFRHSYAIHLLRATKNIRYVQKQLGHTTLATTQIYLQFMEYSQEKAKLGELYI